MKKIHTKIETFLSEKRYFDNDLKDIFGKESIDELENDEEFDSELEEIIHEISIDILINYKNQYSKEYSKITTKSLFDDDKISIKNNIIRVSNDILDKIKNKEIFYELDDEKYYYNINDIEDEDLFIDIIRKLIKQDIKKVLD